MRRLRLVRRMAGLVPFTASLCLFNLALVPVGWFSRRRSEGIRAALLHVWGRGAARILGIRLRIEGTPPEPPGFLVSNHLGYLDIIVLAASLPAAFVGKSELARWPVLGPLMASLGTIFVVRQRTTGLPDVVRRMEEVARGGHTVVFFPEGTSSGGERVLPFKASLFEAPARAGYPVSCASLGYAVPAGETPVSRSVCWWGDMTFADHLGRLLQLPFIDARVRFDARAVSDRDRKRLARAAEEIVTRNFRPVAPEGATEPCAAC